MKALGNSSKLLAFCGLASALTLTTLVPINAQAQDATQRKISLMASALRARESGDLMTAKAQFEELLRMNPSDTRIQQMLAAINADIARQQSSQATVYGQAAGFEPLRVAQPVSSAQTAPAVPVPHASHSELPVTTTENELPMAQTYSVDSQGNMTPTYTSTAVRPAASGSSADAILAEEQSAQRALIVDAEGKVAEARALFEAGRAAEADAILVDLERRVQLNSATVYTLEEARALRSEIALSEGYAALEDNNTEEAEAVLIAYREKMGDDDFASDFEAAIEDARMDPTRQNPEELSPEFLARKSDVEDRLVKARAQILYGDYEGAQSNLRLIEAIDPNNAAAKALQLEILEARSQTEYLDQAKTRSEMLQEVSRAWQRPQVFDLDDDGGPIVETVGLREKLEAIRVPKVEFNGADLSRVINTLSEYTVIYDNSEDTSKGVNMVLMQGSTPADPVTITLRDFTMDQILDFVTETVGYTWDVENGAVVVRRGDGEGTFFETEFFPISRGTIIRLTGGSEDEDSGAAPNPFDPAPAFGGGGGGGSSQTDVEEKLTSFFERAGVPFEGVQGTNLAYDGANIIVTQNQRNLERMRNILRRYDQPKQVEIEAKFLEVQEGALDQLGFNWAVQGDNFAFNAANRGVLAANNGVISDAGAVSGNRNLASSFTPSQQTSDISVIVGGNPVPGSPFGFSSPLIPGAIDVASGVGPQAAAMLGIIDGVDIGLVVDALSRQQGSDLLSSPRLTVLSGRTAEIVVAQELRYPENYGDTEAEVSSEDGGGSVAITPGTPQDFTVRNVGVEMEVTPTVEDNDNISLKLQPRVTEFEGFVEYGGPSVAVVSSGDFSFSGGGGGSTVVTAPSGFYQPIFSTRTVRTEVTVFDGATVVLGGLIREEAKTVNDKVPFLGDVPLLGRLFRSEGETFQKRNLMIFVTANLVSPGGALSRQNLRDQTANTLFQNPVVVTPAGGVSRQATTSDTEQ
jgi:general secretion pathway protein D